MPYITYRTVAEWRCSYCGCLLDWDNWCYWCGDYDDEYEY